MKSTVLKRIVISVISAFAGLLSLIFISLIEEIIKKNKYNKPSMEVLAVAGLPLVYLLLLGFALLTTKITNTKDQLKLNLSLALGLSIVFGILFAAGCSYNKDYASSFLISFFAGLIGFVPVAIFQNYLMRRYAQPVNQGDGE